MGLKESSPLDLQNRSTLGGVRGSASVTGLCGTQTGAKPMIPNLIGQIFSLHLVYGTKASEACVDDSTQAQK